MRRPHATASIAANAAGEATNVDRRIVSLAPRAQRRGRAFVDVQLGVEDHAIRLARVVSRDVFLEHVHAHARRFPVECVAPASAASGHDRDAAFPVRAVCGTDPRGGNRIARRLDVCLTDAPGLAAANAPRCHHGAALLARRPAAFGQPFDRRRDAESTAERSRAARPFAQRTPAHDHRRLEFDRLDGRIAHVALTYRHRCRFAVFPRRAPQPPPSIVCSVKLRPVDGSRPKNASAPPSVPIVAAGNPVGHRAGELR